MNSTTTTLTPAQEKLEAFLKEAKNPNWIIAKSSLNQIEFAIKHASQAAIEQFLSWLYEEGEIDPSAMERLNNGNDSYEDNFEAIREGSWDNIQVEVDDLEDKEQVEDAIISAIDVNEPFGLDSNSTLFYFSQGNCYITTDFWENGETNKNEIIAMVNISKK